MTKILNCLDSLCPESALPGSNYCSRHRPGPALTTVSIDAVIDLLNHWLVIDSPAITALVNARVPCTGVALAALTEVTVTADGTVGLIGILNGLFHPAKLMFVMDGEHIVQFGRLPDVWP